MAQLRIVREWNQSGGSGLRLQLDSRDSGGDSGILRSFQRQTDDRIRNSNREGGSGEGKGGADLPNTAAAAALTIMSGRPKKESRGEES